MREINESTNEEEQAEFEGVCMYKKEIKLCCCTA